MFKVNLMLYRFGESILNMLLVNVHKPVCIVFNSHCGHFVLHTVRPHLPLDVFQHVLMSLEEVKMLKLCIVSLRLHQAALLNVHHLAETIYT